MKHGVLAAQTSEFIVKMNSDIVHPFPFVSEVKPGKMGPVFELRSYTYKRGELPDITKRWESEIHDRIKVSPVALAVGIELGGPTGTSTSGRTRASTTARRSGRRRAPRAPRSPGRRRRAPDAGEQDHAPGGVLARPVANAKEGPPRPPPAPRPARHRPDRRRPCLARSSTRATSAAPRSLASAARPSPTARPPAA